MKCPNCENKEKFEIVEIKEGDRMGWGQMWGHICLRCGILFVEIKDGKIK